MPELTWPLTVSNQSILLCTGVRRLRSRVGASDIARRSRASTAAHARKCSTRERAAAVTILACRYGAAVLACWRRDEPGRRGERTGGVRPLSTAACLSVF